MRRDNGTGAILDCRGNTDGADTPLATGFGALNTLQNGPDGAIIWNISAITVDLESVWLEQRWAPRGVIDQSGVPQRL